MQMPHLKCNSTTNYDEIYHFTTIQNWEYKWELLQQLGSQKREKIKGRQKGQLIFSHLNCQQICREMVSNGRSWLLLPPQEIPENTVNAKKIQIEIYHVNLKINLKDQGRTC